MSEVEVVSCVWSVLKLRLAEALRQEYVTRHGFYVGLIGTATIQRETQNTAASKDRLTTRIVTLSEEHFNLASMR